MSRKYSCAISTPSPLHNFHAVMTGLFHGIRGDWREQIQMAKTSPGSLSRGLEFEIIGDYTHPSPFLKKKREICLIPLSGPASKGAQGRLASITALKKAQNIRNQEEPWPRLAGKKASWRANKRCWVWLGRGRRHLATDHSGQWGHHWPAGLCGELSWKMEGLSRELSVDLRVWTAVTTHWLSPSNHGSTISDNIDWQLSKLHVCCSPTLLWIFSAHWVGLSVFSLCFFFTDLKINLVHLISFKWSTFNRGTKPTS